MGQTGVPTLRVPPALSQVAIPVRQVNMSVTFLMVRLLIQTSLQAMLKNLYDHFVVLYEKILPANPSLATEHALKQEQEVYSQSTKATYRNVSCDVRFLLKSLAEHLRP
jgi:RNA exonuclease 1